MTKKQIFIDYINEVVGNNMPDEVKMYWDMFCATTEKEKPMFTDNGKLILEYMREHVETPMWKARDIAEGLFISSRTVSGAMRKLVTDGYVEKVGQEPVIYALTENGKNIQIN